MPLYDYRCPGCGCKFEKRVRIAEAEGVRCPKCGVVAKKQISAPSQIVIDPMKGFG